MLYMIYIYAAYWQDASVVVEAASASEAQKKALEIYNDLSGVPEADRAEARPIADILNKVDVRRVDA